MYRLFINVITRNNRQAFKPRQVKAANTPATCH